MSDPTKHMKVLDSVVTSPAPTHLPTKSDNMKILYLAIASLARYLLAPLSFPASESSR